MKLNEEIDTISNENELKAKLKNIDGDINELLLELYTHFEANHLSEAKRCLRKFNYLRRSKNIIHKKLGFD